MTTVATAAPAGDDETRKPAKRRVKFDSNPTAKYHPAGQNWWGFATAALDGRPVFTWLDVGRMLSDPRVLFIEKLWRAPFQRQKFEVKAEKKAVANFVEATARRFWRRSLPRHLTKYFRYGFSAGGAEFAARRGYYRLERVKAVRQGDATPKVFAGGDREGCFAGFTLRAKDKPREVLSPHAFWFAGQMEYSEFYDVPPLSLMFQPWLEKNGRQGAIHMRRLWFRKHAVRGMKGRFPPGTTNVGTDESPRVLNNQDVMREMLEFGESMSVYCMENGVNPGLPGEYDWEIEDLEAHADVAGYLEYPDKLNDEMLEAVGIPKEVVQSSESGSGYNGRLIPYQGFLAIVDELSGLITEAMDQWMRPLVEQNFGPDSWYEVQPISLAEQAEQDQQQKQKRSGELPAKPGMGGDLPFTLSTYDERRVRRGWVANRHGNFLRVVGQPRRKAVRAHELSATDYAGDKPHKFSSTHILLPPELAGRLAHLAAKIPDDALADDGREDEFHVTVRYGLHADSPDAAAEVIENFPPIRVSLGGVSVFRGADSGKDYDVLKVDVSSPDLRRLNRELAALPHTDTHAGYCPHATIAYLKAGTGDTFAALAQPLNADFTAAEVVFSSQKGEKTTIPLMTTPPQPPAAATDPAVLEVLKKLAEGVALLAQGQQAKPPLELAATVTPEDDPAAKAQAFQATANKLTRNRKSTVVQLLALAMLRAQQRAQQAGHPDAAAGSLDGVAELAGDPVQVARLVGMKEMSATDLSALELAWHGPYTGDRGGTFFVNDAGAKKYTKDKPGEKREKRQADAKLAKRSLTRIAHGVAGPEDLGRLKDNVQALTAGEIRAYQNVIGYNLKGVRNKRELVNRILAHVDSKLGQKAGAEQPKPPKPEPTPQPAAPEPVPEVPGEPVAEVVTGQDEKPKPQPKAEEPPAPVAKEVAAQVEKPAAPAKRPRNTPSVVAPGEAQKLKAAVAYNALLEAAQSGASPEQIGKLHERAKAAAAEFVPDAGKRAALLEHLTAAASGKGKLLPLPAAGEAEGVDPGEELPTEAESQANEEAIKKALAAQATPPAEPDDGEGEDRPEEKSALLVKAEKARDLWRAAVRAKKKPADVARLKMRLDEYAAALPAGEKATLHGAPGGSAKAAAEGILGDPETQALLAKRRAAKPAPQSGDADKARFDAARERHKKRQAEFEAGRKESPAHAPFRDPKQAVLDAVHDVLDTDTSATRLPVARLRQEVARRHGGRVSREQFDQALADLKRSGELDAYEAEGLTPEQERERVSTPGGNLDLVERTARTPASTTPPPAPPPELESFIHATAADMLRGDATGMAGVPKLRAAVRAKFGDSAASRRVFDETLLKMRREGAARLISVDDRSRYGHEALAHGVHSVGENFQHFEPVGTPPGQGAPPVPQPAESAKPKSPPPRQPKKPPKAKPAGKPKADTVEQLAAHAAQESDPVLKDYLESALHNYGDDGVAATLEGLGGSVEETSVNALDGRGGGLRKRDIPPEHVDKVRSFLQAAGAAEDGPGAGEQAPYDHRRYQPPEEGAYWPGDPVTVVRPPLVLNGRVVTRGVVTAAKPA